MYLLCDANVVAGYYLPRCLSSVRARERIRVIMESIRSGAADHFLYIPNFCIAEVFSVFAKHSFGRWNQHVRSRGTIDSRVYKSIVRQFEEDIHNGRFLYQYELGRYHILGIDLVAPVDHYYQISRSKGRRHAPMGTLDHLIISMGIQLAHVHGVENTAIITADSRLTDVLAKLCQGLPAKTVRKLKLEIAEEVTGRKFGPELFPRYINLKTATKKDLIDLFGTWPLPVDKMPKVYRWLR